MAPAECNAVVRTQLAKDQTAVRELIIASFTESEWGHNGEAELVFDIENACAPERQSAKSPEQFKTYSWVAEVDDILVGQIFYSPVSILVDSNHPESGENPGVVGTGLGPWQLALNTNAKASVGG